MYEPLSFDFSFQLCPVDIDEQTAREGLQSYYIQARSNSSGGKEIQQERHQTKKEKPAAHQDRKQFPPSHLRLIATGQEGSERGLY